MNEGKPDHLVCMDLRCSLSAVFCYISYLFFFLSNSVASPDTSVSVFSWQVKAYGQGTLSTYIGVFDINRWYHAQMPDSLRYNIQTFSEKCQQMVLYNKKLPVTFH